MKALSPPKNLRVARISFLNTDPFFLGWEGSPSLSVLSATPRELGLWAEQGKVDAGLLSLADLWRLEADFEPLEDFGIAVKTRAASVLLFSQVPLEGLGGAVVSVTDQTSTSVKLLEVLLNVRHGVHADLRRGDQERAKARLLIGDEALKASWSGLPGFSLVFDLSQEWHRWQRRPFVFAHWGVRRGLPAHLKEELAARLARSLELFKEQRAEVAAAGARRLGLPEPFVLDYLAGFTFRLGQAEDEAEKTFRGFFTGEAARCLC